MNETRSIVDEVRVIAEGMSVRELVRSALDTRETAAVSVQCGDMLFANGLNRFANAWARIAWETEHAIQSEVK